MGTIGGMNTPPRPIVTPCTKVCCVDGQSGFCLGGQRTLPEIAQWSRMNDASRAAVMADLPARKAKIAPEKLALI